jgi:hypothetical protein
MVRVLIRERDTKKKEKLMVIDGQTGCVRISE